MAPAYLLPAMKINPLPAGFVIPAQPVRRQNRRPAPIGFTKSSMTDIGRSSAGTALLCGSTAATRMTGLCD
jgi:hypothetical protein